MDTYELIPSDESDLRERIISCDKFLISKTNDIIKIAKNNNIYEEIVYILRSKQSLINRLKDLIRLCNNKLSLLNL